MRTGKSIVELAKELERQQNSKRDFVADTRAIELDRDGQTLKLSGNGAIHEASIDGQGGFKVNTHCHSQIGDRIGIPRKYYQRMLSEAPVLLSTNVNYWMRHNPEERMLRTLDGRARAFLSRRYRTLDNYDIGVAALEKISDAGCQVMTSELTDLRMYIQAVNFKVEGEVKKGDIVKAGIIVSNSEVGAGAVKIEPLIYRLACLNGMVMPDYSLKKYHVGRNKKGMELTEDAAAEFFRDETRKADDKAFFMKVQDLVAAALEQTKFEKIIERLRDAHEQKIESTDLTKVVEVTQKKLQLSEGEKNNVLSFLIQGGDLSKWGLANAVTATANEHEDYDRAVELERAGGMVIELPQTDWKEISTAAA